MNPGLEISVSFPGYETLQGAVVEAKPDYVVFNILKYPFTIILLTTIASVIYYCRIGRMERKQTGLILQNTIRKIVPTEITPVSYTHLDVYKRQALVIAAVVAASLLPPQVLRLIVDDYLMAGKAEGLLVMGGIYLGTFALVGFFDFLKGWLLTTVCLLYTSCCF